MVSTLFNSAAKIESIRQVLSAVLLIGLVAGCSEESAPSNKDAAPMNSETIKAAPEPVKRQRFLGEATVQLGDDSFELDLVVCIKGMTISAVASDSKKRVEYPVVKLGTSDPKYTGGTPMNTVSLMFSGDGLEQLWQLDEGGVWKEGKNFTAEGTVKGRQMEKQADGTLQSRPLEGDDIKPFRIEAKCR